AGGDELETPEAYAPDKGQPARKYGGDLPAEDESEGQIALLGRNAEALNKPRPQHGDQSGKKRRRRGRRGGARRRKHRDGPAVPGVHAGPPPTGPVHRQRPPQHGRPANPRRVEQVEREQAPVTREIEPAAIPATPTTPAAPAAVPPTPSISEPVSHETEGRIGPAAYQARTRVADPALASRLAQLESQLRRLLAGPSHPVSDADKAPAGPGVFVVSDSDMSTSYYVEACQTLRIGIGNVARSGRSREGANIKEKMAEHLGITESRVSAYLKEHCIVRWLQLDDGAALLAHFAIAVLRPVVNE
ncbi:MAG TPA: hypothetical protein VFO34_00895, partial [Candidatus Acidoferrales bacterium]|nr:hypothetical protein [Candidatus Acidoferrales bacterium]